MAEMQLLTNPTTEVGNVGPVSTESAELRQKVAEAVATLQQWAGGVHGFENLQQLETVATFAVRCLDWCEVLRFVNKDQKLRRVVDEKLVEEMRETAEAVQGRILVAELGDAIKASALAAASKAAGAAVESSDPAWFAVVLEEGSWEQAGGELGVRVVRQCAVAVDNSRRKIVLRAPEWFGSWAETLEEVSHCEQVPGHFREEDVDMLRGALSLWNPWRGSGPGGSYREAVRTTAAVWRKKNPGKET